MSDANRLEPSLPELLADEGYVNPVLLRRIFLLIFREHFSDPNNYGLDEIKDLYYDGTEQSPLDIKLDFTYSSEDIGKKPAIYIGLGNFAFKNQVIDDYAGSSADNSTIYSTTQGTTNIIIRHLSMSSDLSLALATQSLHLAGGIRNLIVENFPSLLDYSVSSLTPPALVDPEKIKIFQSNLTLNIAFNMTWTTTIEGLRIKTIAFRTDHSS